MEDDESFKVGPSYVFFTDDLILFGEASNTQAKIMSQTMERFCQASGQKANTQKSKLYISKNTSASLVLDMTNKFDIPIAEDLGNYLGMLIIHGRVSRNLYEFLATKACKKQSGWKRHTLSRAARMILIQSVTSVVPSYATQTTRLPACILQDLEKLN